MNLLYISNQRMPTEKAYGIQIAKMCEAFVKQGCSVELVIPTRYNEVKGDIFSYFGVPKVFKVSVIPTLDFSLPGFLETPSFLLKNYLSARKLGRYADKSNARIIYSRDEIALTVMSSHNRILVYEAHKFSFHKLGIYKKLIVQGVKLVVITSHLKKIFQEIGFPKENIFVAPDGVDLAEFDIQITKTEAREKLGLPVSKNIIMYTGHLYDWKGAHTLLEIAPLATDKELIVLVGGTQEDIDIYKEKIEKLGQFASRVVLAGHKPHAQIPLYLKAADILVLPNSQEEKISELYTSPLKLFEYMAADRPIIASDLPSLRDILNEHNARLITMNKENLSNAVMNLLSEPVIADRLAHNAHKDAQRYSWQQRADSIVDFITL